MNWIIREWDGLLALGIIALMILIGILFGTHPNM
tara:strand:- start:1456 stop:1557 length:102 start_codon:yes stop_codon:yes gene_type:complete